MKLWNRLLLWALSVLTVVLSVLLISLALVPSLGWMQIPAVRIVVGVLALLSIFAAVAVHVRRAADLEQGEAAMVSEGEDGSAYVALNVLSDMAKRIVQDCEGVRSCKSAVKNNGSGVDVELDMALHPGVAVAPMATMIQEQLKSRIYEMTGIRVGKVSILVEAAAEAKASKQIQAPAEQLPSRVK